MEPCIAVIGLPPGDVPSLEVGDADGVAIPMESLTLRASGTGTTAGTLLGQAVNQLIAEAAQEWILLWGEPCGVLRVDWAAMTADVFCGEWAGAAGMSSSGWLLMHRRAFENVHGCHPLLRSASLLITDCQGRLEAQGVRRLPPLQCTSLLGCPEQKHPIKDVSRLESLTWSEALVLAERDADLEADAALLVSHPWGPAQAMVLPSSLQRKWLRIWRLTFWSSLLLLPERIPNTCPESWFPAPNQGIVRPQAWHQWYWRWLRRGVSQLEGWLLGLMHLAGGC